MYLDVELEPWIRVTVVAWPLLSEICISYLSKTLFCVMQIGLNLYHFIGNLIIWLRCDERLAAMFTFRDPNPEKQAKRVLLGTWQQSASAPRSMPATTTIFFMEAGDLGY